MKRFVILLLLVFSANFAFADGDLWDNFGDSNTYGQKAVSDQEFNKAIESKQKKKKRDKNIPKGESFSQSDETAALTNTTKEPQILLIPLNLKSGNIIPVGHYSVEGVKEGNEVYLKLYQAHKLIAKLPAEETDDDFGEETINFVRIIPYGDYHVQIIYGGVDFNAYSIIDIE